jgi:octaprenyl-diphosphate synthase
MKDFGENIGIAFQIRDDILDYDSKGMTGKVHGNDIKEKKITLPLIYALEQTTVSKRKKILSIVSKKKKTREEIADVIQFVIDNGGIEYAAMRMNQYRDKALAILDTYPPTDVRQSLRNFVLFTTSRDK